MTPEMLLALGMPAAFVVVWTLPMLHRSQTTQQCRCAPLIQ